MFEPKQTKEYSMCFACGKDNPIGLHLQFHAEGDSWVTEFTPGPEHQSYDGRVHGGLLSVLLDEITGDYIFKLEGRPAYTAKMELRFRQPVRIGTTVKAVATLMSRHGRLATVHGVVYNPDGQVAAECVSKLMVEPEPAAE